MKKILLIIGILALASPALALELSCIPNATAEPIAYNCTETNNSNTTLTLISITTNMTTIEQKLNIIIGNLTTNLTNGTVKDLSTMFNQSVSSILTDYKNISDSLRNCSKYLDENKTALANSIADLDKCKSNASIAEICRIDLNKKGQEMDAIIGNMTGLVSSCQASVSGMVPRSELTACQLTSGNQTVNYILVAIGAIVGFWFLFVRNKNKTDQNVKERTGDVMRDRIPSH